MAGIKISDLPAAPSAQLTDVFPVDQLPGPITYKESNQQLLSLFQTSGGFVLLNPTGNQTILNAFNLIMSAGSIVAPTVLPGNLSLTANTLSSTNVNGNINYTPNGTGVNAFNKNITLQTAADPTFTIFSDDGLGTSFTQIQDTDLNNCSINKTASSGTALIGINPLPLDGVSDGRVKMFRATNSTSPTSGLQIYKGDGTTSLQSFFSCNSNSFLNAAGGGVMIGTGSTPTNVMDVRTDSSGTTVGLIRLTNASASAINTGVSLDFQPNTSSSRSASIKSLQTIAGDRADLEFYTCNATTPALAMAISVNQIVSLTNPLAETSGGTHQSTYTLGDTLYASAANTLSKLAGNSTSGIQYLSQTGTGAVSAAPVWASISGGDITGAALSKADDTNVTLTLTGTPTTALLRATTITAGWTGQLGLTRGGSNASLTASNGGIVYSTASAMAILAGTATAGQHLQSGASGAPSWTTATFPAISGTTGTILRSNGTNWVNSTATFADTYTASNLLYSNGANTVTGLATANSSVLVTSGSGVPSLSTALPASLTATNMVLTTPTLGVASATSINFGGGALSAYVPRTAWTPVFTFTTPGDISLGSTSTTAFYVRVGDLVTLSCDYTFTPTYTTASGNARINGAPITTVAGQGNLVTNIVAAGATLGVGGTDIFVSIGGGLTVFSIAISTATGGFANATTTNFPSGVAYTLRFITQYYAA